MQDLREVSKWVEIIHPVVLNPYMLLSLLPPEKQVDTALDFKDTFFCLLLSNTFLPLNGQILREDLRAN